MKKPKLPQSFIAQCKRVIAKRPRTVIDHILKHGHITTQELKDTYGYNHSPRAARDVREQGIPLETFRVVGSDGRSIGAYRFGNPAAARLSLLRGRTAFSKELKQALTAREGCRCAIYLEEFPERELQIDHRIPFEVAGDVPENTGSAADYMLLCASANRAKSWSCEHCANWRDLKNPDVCRKCYWAYPDSYEHVAMRPIRRLDIVWSGKEEVEVFEELKRKTESLQKRMPAYVKEIIRKHVQE